MPGSPGAAGLVCSGVTVTAPTATGDLTLLRDVDVALRERRVAVVGLNGSGKSTFLRLFNGLVRPSSGSVTVHGTDVGRDVRAARRRVGFVFTDPLSQLVMPTPVEDVELSLRGAGVARAGRRAAALALLERVGIAHRAEHSIYDLSGGERQLAAFAAVLAVEPEVLVLDEPTTLLDLRNRARLVRLLDGLPHQLLISTHDLGLAATAPRVLVLHEGALVADGSPEQVVPAYEDWCAHGFPPGGVPVSRGPDLFGSHRPGTSVLHRTPLGAKGLGILAVTAAVVLAPSWTVPGALSVLLLAGGAAAGVGAREWWRGLAPALPVLVPLAAYHALTTGPRQAADVVLTIVVFLVLARVLMHTTPLPDLLDGVVRLCVPVRIVGADPERIGLAISLMLRSVPFIVGAVGDLQDAVRARGLRPNPVRLLTPAVISTVAYAERTGEALAARGFD